MLAPIGSLLLISKIPKSSKAFGVSASLEDVGPLPGSIKSFSNSITDLVRSFLEVLG
jgi:hypothetical protein